MSVGVRESKVFLAFFSTTKLTFENPFHMASILCLAKPNCPKYQVIKLLTRLDYGVHKQTNKQTDRMITVSLAVHACQGIMKALKCNPLPLL